MRERAKKGDLPVLQLPCSVSVTRFAALSCDGCDSAPALAAACNGTETPQNVLCKLSLSDYVKSLSTHPKLKSLHRPHTSSRFQTCTSSATGIRLSPYGLRAPRSRGITHLIILPGCLGPREAPLKARHVQPGNRLVAQHVPALVPILELHRVAP